MNVIFISECSKNALSETRRVLDHFAERKGERTWQTPITDEGLKSVRQLLRKRARKNTAVSCYWVRAKNQTELLWIVGDRSKFNESGTIPTNFTKRNILRAEDENGWMTWDAIYGLSAMAALCHDLGKASEAFQQMLRGKPPVGGNPVRHEWVSLALFANFVKGSTQDDWLDKLVSPNAWDEVAWTEGAIDIVNPFDLLKQNPIAEAVGWLILSHHRMPTPAMPEDLSAATLGGLLTVVRGNWNSNRHDAGSESYAQHWSFPQGTSLREETWRKAAARVSKRLIALRTKEPQGVQWLDNAWVMHLARASLMLADHNYSSKPAATKAPRSALYANTTRADGSLRQPLLEHLLNVYHETGQVARGLIDIEAALPRLARCRALKRRAENERFRWQDKAHDAAVAIRKDTETTGAFIVNMASTGTGKTLANAKIMYALGAPELGARFTVALGLRTLTRQTGEVFREKLGLDDDVLAVRVGGAPQAVADSFFRDSEGQGDEHPQGLENVDFVDDTEHYVSYEGDYGANPLLSRLSHNDNIKRLVDPPVLVCTVDHLVPATESSRGGHQIPCMLRLLTSDLVLDEVDDYSLEDLPAIARLVNWAGMLGSRVLLSSATLSPALLDGLFEAYSEGRKVFAANRGDAPWRGEITCLWVDESSVQRHACASREQFAENHRIFVEDRVKRLKKATVRRKGTVVETDDLFGSTSRELHQAYGRRMVEEGLALHGQHHTVLPDGRRVSFGLLRMANIDPIIDAALGILSESFGASTQIHLCVYHSRFPIIVRSGIEATLDRVLHRATSQPWEHPVIQRSLGRSDALDQVFIVLASPVAEVGRDHDYDWAVVEPSSMRSMIQLAGRIRRHRYDAVSAPNIAVMSKNLRALKSPAGPAFIRPGYEDRRSNATRMASYDLRELLRPDELHQIDATPRVVESIPLEPTKHLSDLEHARTRELYTSTVPVAAASRSRHARNHQGTALNMAAWWRAPRAPLTGMLQRKYIFRFSGPDETVLVFLPDDQGDLVVHEMVPQKRDRPLPTRIERSRVVRIDIEANADAAYTPQIWATPDLEHALDELSAAISLDDEMTAMIYTETKVLTNSRDGRWRYHPLLGFGTIDAEGEL